MNISSMSNEINQFDALYHKLVFLVNKNENINTMIPLLDKYEKIDINRVLSEKLISIPTKKYPMYISDFLEKELMNKDSVYVLRHIDILFDPVLQINPVRLLENLSRMYKLIVEWPGRYIGDKLIYAEYGHPEYFVCQDFEGKIIMK